MDARLIYRLSPFIYRLSPFIYRLSPFIYKLSPYYGTGSAACLELISICTIHIIHNYISNAILGRVGTHILFSKCIELYFFPENLKKFLGFISEELCALRG